MNDSRENLQEQPLLPPLVEAVASITVENLRAIAVAQLERITGVLARNRRNFRTKF